MSDAEKMAQFRNHFSPNPMRSSTAPYYHWKLMDNPYGQGRFYLEQREGKVAGSTTLTPKNVAVYDTVLPAAEIGDTFTHPDFRRQGIFSRGVTVCTEYAIEQGRKIIYGTPNSQSLPGYEQKLHYTECRNVHWRYLCKPLRITRSLGMSFLKMCLFRHSRLHYQRCRELMSLHAGSKTLKKACRTIQIKKGKVWESDSNGLWGTGRYLFCTVRDRKYITWRFFENPDEYIFLTAHQEGVCCGYLALKISQDRRTSVLCDFITHNDDPTVFQALLYYAETESRKAGCRIIHLWYSENNTYFPVLLEAGYREPPQRQDRPVIVYQETEEGLVIIQGTGFWHFTLADTDNI